MLRADLNSQRANPPKKSKSRSSTHAQPKPKVTERKVRTKTQKEAQASRDSAILAKMNGNEGEDDFRGALMAVTAVVSLLSRL